MSFWWRSTRGLTCRYIDTAKQKEEFFHYFANWAFFVSLKKQPTFLDVTTSFPAKWRLKNWRRNSILMTRHYPDLGSVTSQVWHSCARFSDVISWENQWCQCRLFFQASSLRVIWHFSLDFHHPFFSLFVAFLPYFWIDGDNAVRPEQRTVGASKDGECKAHARKTGTVCTKVEKNYKINKILSPEEIFPPIFV